MTTERDDLSDPTERAMRESDSPRPIPEQELLMRYLEGTLDPGQRARLQGRLDADVALAERLGRLARLRETMEEGRPRSFAVGFSDRVLRRLEAEEAPAERLYEALHWVFARTALASMLVAGALGAYNVTSYQGLGVAASLLEALFGLPSATLADALSYGTF